MKQNNFVWTDLSTYTPESTRTFYEELFSWKIHDQEKYGVCFSGNNEVCGMYETPEFFKSINMPHFWMGYIQVDNVKDTVEAAKRFGGTIEIEKDEFYGGNIALIRDPLGAGFTIYDGDGFHSQNRSENHYLGSELHISDLTRVQEFYEKIFDWELRDIGEGISEIYSKANKQKIASILEIDNSIKGKHEYWTVIFGTRDLSRMSSKIKELGGDIISQEVDRVLCIDNSGEAFFYIQQL